MQALDPSAVNPSASSATQPQPPTSLPSWRREPVRLSDRASPRRFDWPKAAKLLAIGTPAAEIAEALGCEEARVWRHLHSSPLFRAMVQKEVERNRAVHALRMEELRHRFAETLFERQDLAPETIERLAGQPQAAVKSDQLESIGRRARAPSRKKLAIMRNMQESNLAIMQADKIMREAMAARDEMVAAMAQASPVTKTPECPGSAGKQAEAAPKTAANANQASAGGAPAAPKSLQQQEEDALRAWHDLPPEARGPRPACILSGPPLILDDGHGVYDERGFRIATPLWHPEHERRGIMLRPGESVAAALTRVFGEPEAQAGLEPANGTAAHRQSIPRHPRA